MKKSFWLVLVFFVFFLIILLAAAFFAMLAENCMHLEAGVKSDFFNLSFFIDSLIKYLPWCAVLSLMMLVLYIIKHKFSVLQFVIPYFILALLVWMLVIPGCAKLSSIRQGASDISGVAEIADAEAVEGADAQAGGEVVEVVEEVAPVLEPDVVEPDASEPDAGTISKGYFRKEGEYLTFGDMWRRKVFPGRVDEETSGKYSDIIIESSISVPFWGDYVYEKCLLLNSVCRSALAKGYFSFILFATMGFALSAVIFLCRFSSWRLVNALIVMFVFALIVFANIVFYDGAFVEKIPFLGNWYVPLIFNGVLCVLFMTVGIFNWVRHPDRNREGE